jgi:hypothetical protein
LEVELEASTEVSVGSSEKASYPDKKLPKDQTGKSRIRTQLVVAIFRPERKITCHLALHNISGTILGSSGHPN